MRKTLKVFLLIALVAVLIYGIKKNEAKTTFLNASNICLSCIGLE